MGGPNAGLVDAFVGKYDASGELQWIQQIGSPNEEAAIGVATDDLGNVYVSGSTWELFSGPWPAAESNDVFVNKYDDMGRLQWTRLLATNSADVNSGIAADGSRKRLRYGQHRRFARRTPQTGVRDAFVAKFDEAGAICWTAQFGTDRWDIGSSVAADRFGSIYIAGMTQGDLARSSGGNFDAFVGALDPVPEPSTLVVAMLGLILPFASKFS